MPRRPPHFKVYTSVQNHRKADFWEDPRLRGIWLGLGVLAVERYADRTGDSFLCCAADLMAVTGTSRGSGAVAALRSLCRRSTVSLEPDGTRWRVTFPNLSEKQFFRSGNGTQTVSSSSSSSSSSSKIPPTPQRGEESGGLETIRSPRLNDFPRRLRDLVEEDRKIVDWLKRGGSARAWEVSHDLEVGSLAPLEKLAAASKPRTFTR
jgi:hypothetical protein